MQSAIRRRICLHAFYNIAADKLAADLYGNIESLHGGGVHDVTYYVSESVNKLVSHNEHIFRVLHELANNTWSFRLHKTLLAATSLGNNFKS